MTDATPAVCVAAQQDSTGITSSVQAGLMRASTPRLDELAQMSLEALVAPEVGIASWRAIHGRGDRVLRAASAWASDAGVALDPVRVPAQ